MTSNLNKMVKISLLTGIAFILMFIEFPIIPIFPWLKMDISDVPALMGAFAFGPLAGVLIEFLKVTMNFLLSGSSTGGVGEVANFIIGASFVAPAAFIYWKNKSKKSALLGMIFGIIIMEVVAIIANVYFLLPVYGMNMAPAELMQYVTVGLLPFNGIKGIVISVLTYAIYKKVSVSIFKVEPNFGSNSIGSNSKGKIA
ncbi:ECF transporter S component [Clostridium sardiniense]|uniref:Riboflavin transporter n=1 Tax=Clostridium sardiniense TaxID=29369 RepID=A0ABS7KYA6_CLOSR|nr:ECF transporter S component [Clostridium sardiniense]MBM7835800.1 riboflavin transporter FmnP [Clostridium sardiniense]MBY0755796.1 ECF transporter S component [Clostridium sardiniense]MDQ0459976.1 riboflavin transporter FmnP [Clostridium sardiniense]